MTSQTTRRAILAGAAALPIAAAAPALPASADESTIDKLAAELTAATARHDKVLDAMEIADKAMFAWEKRNPKAVLREFKSNLGWCSHERDLYLKQVSEADDPSEVTLTDPCADEIAAVREYEAAMNQRAQRKASAKAQCGHDAAHAAEGTVCSELADLIDKLASTTASTMRSLRIKASLATKFQDADLAWSIVDDLLGVPGVTA